MISGAAACKLGAMIHGAELRVHFLKSFQKGSTCENLLRKGLKIKKVGHLYYFTRHGAKKYWITIGLVSKNALHKVLTGHEEAGFHIML
jgi:hypothetical protein